MSYVAARTQYPNRARLQHSQLDLRVSATSWKEGVRVLQRKLPNRSIKQPAFLGIFLYFADSVALPARTTVSAVHGDLLRQGLNSGATWYNSLQINYTCAAEEPQSPCRLHLF